VFVALGGGRATPALADEVPQGQVLDRVVAVVNGRVLTQSQLELEARVALIQRGGPEAGRVELDPAALRAALDYAIAQRLASDEADKLQAFPVEESEVDGALQTLKERMGGARAFEQFLARQETDLPHLQAILSRGLRADKLLLHKVRLKAQATDADARAYYDAHPEQQGQPFEVVRAALREKLSAERFQQLVAQEIAVARKNADVRLVAPWARVEHEGGS
jgi:hypothetical protein